MEAGTKLVRRQILIYPKQARKIKLLAKKKNTSAAEMMRQAIDAFDPDAIIDIAESDLLELASAKVKEAITDTIATRKKVTAALDMLEEGRPKCPV